MTDHKRPWRGFSSSFYLSLSLSSIPRFPPLPERSLSLPEPPPPTPLPRPWLQRVASECQMYYRVSHGNVNTQPCHESRVVWPPSFPFLAFPSIPPSSLPHSADCQRGGESTTAEGERVCVCVFWGGVDRAREEAGV